MEEAVNKNAFKVPSYKIIKPIHIKAIISKVGISIYNTNPNFLE